jgi:hypothetical protein
MYSGQQWAQAGSAFQQTKAWSSSSDHARTDRTAAGFRPTPE